MDKIIKTITEPEIKEIDEKKRIIWHKISVEKKDRMNDIVRIDGIDTKNFKKKPTVLYGHMYSGLDPLPVIGQNIGFKKEGKKYYAGTKFLDPEKDDISPKLADLVNDLWTLNKKKLMGWSVGFIPVETADLKEGDKVVGQDFKKSELLEYSNVILPANQDAVNDAVEKGEITKEFTKSLKKEEADSEELPGEVAVASVNASLEEENDLFPLNLEALDGGIKATINIFNKIETKPSKENHVCRLNNGDYSRYRSEKRKHEGKEYTVRFGIKRSDGKAEEYEYFYPKDTWSASEAKSHCKDHKGKFEAATGKEIEPCEDKEGETGQNPDQINETLILIDKRFGIRARIRNFILNQLRR